MDLTKIENILNKYEKIDQAIAVLKEDDQGKNIEVYIKLLKTEDNVQDTIIQEIKRYLIVNLPYSLMPSQIKIVDELPLLLKESHSKNFLEKRALDSQINLNYTSNNPVDIELTLRNIWCKILTNKEIHLNDNFFDLGGESLKATLIISQIKIQLRVEITFREFFSFPTINLLGKLIKDKQKINN